MGGAARTTPGVRRMVWILYVFTNISHMNWQLVKQQNEKNRHARVHVGYNHVISMLCINHRVPPRLTRPRVISSSLTDATAHFEDRKMRISVVEGATADFEAPYPYMESGPLG